ncbi:MAG: glycoside hydrolase family 127 protein, partial [Eubacteriales bacterium]|nr:glycoside hydrolase family 127 protein [Eubacteriales bacterium]
MISPDRCTPFTSRELKPTGWLKRQLTAQAQGLSGHLHEVWPDIRDSAWIGGTNDGWERVPYWLDGFVPLAYLLEDDVLIATARRYMDAILTAQQEDGWLCPCPSEERGRYDTWAYLLICKVLTVYADCSGDERVIPALERGLRCLSLHLDVSTLFNWGSARWFEGLVSVLWLYERQPAPWLIDLAWKLRAQGVDWEAVFDAPFIKTPERHWTFLTHVVNLAMMLKSQALFSRVAGGDASGFARKALALLEKYHGTAAGHFTGDECLAGNSPIQGTELCGVAEAMYSYEQLFAVTGEANWCDRLEKLAFNALPAAISTDMWTHQYDQMTNQVCCSVMEEGRVVFGTNSGESHLFGLEPNFGCCTANFNQAWPKFALSTFFADEEGLICAALAPCVLTTAVAGAPVRCEMITDYPFRDTLTCRVECGKATEFSLKVRIPAWVESFTCTASYQLRDGFAVIRQTWQGVQEIGLTFHMSPRMEARPGGLFCVRRGALLYALDPGERWEKRE